MGGGGGGMLHSAHLTKGVQYPNELTALHEGVEGVSQGQLVLYCRKAFNVIHPHYNSGSWCQMVQWRLYVDK